MTSGSLQTRAVLRIAWFALLLLLLAFVWPLSGVIWRAGTGLLWLTGALLLVPARRSATLAATWADGMATLAPRVSMVLLAALLVFAVPVFTMFGAVVLALLLGSALLATAAAGRAPLLRDGLPKVATLAVTVALVSVGGEMVLRLPVIVRRNGTPEGIRGRIRAYDQLWTRNRFHIRSRYEEVRKPAGVRRVVVVGDSYTWGDGIAQTDSVWPAVLERTLRSQWADSGIQVVNVGHGASRDPAVSLHPRRDPLECALRAHRVSVQSVAAEAVVRRSVGAKLR